MPENAEESEENVYGNTARTRLMEDGEISAEEDGFMQGYDEAEGEEEETQNDAYEKAFASRRRKRKTESAADPFEDDEVYVDDD